jgi:hypothetical protein
MRISFMRQYTQLDFTAIDKQLKDVRAFLAEYEQHKTALEIGETFVPQLTTTAHKVQSAGKKRKNTCRGKSGSPKRHKSFGDDDDDDFEIDDIDDDLNDDIQVDDEDEGSEEEEEDDSDGEEDAQDEPEEEVTIEVLQEKIGDAEEAIKDGREQLNNARKTRKDAIDALSNLKKKGMKAQRDKNAFCSLKRSEVCLTVNFLTTTLTRHQPVLPRCFKRRFSRWPQRS